MSANGMLVESELVEVEGQRLAPLTAAAYLALRHAAHRAGHTISLWTPVGGYRDRRTQQDMLDRPWLYNIKPGVRLAAVGQSRHGQGRAVDIKAQNGAGRNWVAANAHLFGLTRNNPIGDPDHYESGSVLATEPPAVNPPRQETEMLRLVYGSYIPAQPAATPANGAGYYLVNGDTGKYIQVIGTQARCNMLSEFITNPATFQAATTKADFDWLIGVLAQLAATTPSGGSGGFSATDRARLESVPTAAENAKAVVAEIAS
jgi:hypothetical protein